MLSSCLAVVHAAGESEARGIAERFEALAGFYAPLAGDDAAFEVGSVRELGVVHGRLALAAGEVRESQVLCWGERLPEALATPRALVGAGDGDLRGIAGSSAAFAVHGGRARLLTGGGPITALYVARGDGCTAWSTHALAAAWLAHGEVELDGDAVVDLIALEYVPGERALVAGAAPVDPGTRIDFGHAGPETTAYWPRAERWAAIPAGEAQTHAETALLDGLHARLADGEPIHLGLTGGADSRVAACALAELGLDFSAVTWGDAEWPDAVGAGKVAAALGVPHVTAPPRYEDPGAGALRAALAWARWSEGGLPIRLAGPTWPAPLRSFVTGAGAETGRAFYYRRWADGDPNCSTGDVAGRFGGLVGRRLRGAPRSTVRAAEDRARALVLRSAELGHKGWSALDVLYGEQRVGRWARAHLPLISAQLVPAFGTAEVMRSLASLPLADRMGDAFNRRFVAAREPALALPEPPPAAGDRRGLRRVAATVLPERARELVGGILASRRPAGRWLFADRWPAYAELRDWIADEALASPVLRGSMGDRWADRVRDGFLAGEDSPTSVALLASAPAALDRALRDLR